MKNYSRLRLSKLAAFCIFSLLISNVHAQLSKKEFESDGEKYIYPVHPGQPGSLAGTMGELRTTHFHSGIDIRTNNTIGYPVVASKSGYISRVTVTPSGYGNIIYIRHPDGNTTLYAHLDKFAGKLGEHVLQEQYRQKSFSVDLTFSPEQFKVKQGELIALSGNTGSSGGPHVHFDIRDVNNYALDPLKVAAFPEIVDKLPPAPEKIALKTLDINSRINDKFGRFEFHAASRGGSKYTMAAPILASGTIGLEIIAKDRLAPGSPFWGGVNHIEVRVDSQLVFKQSIDKIDITETRGIYTLMDFKTLRNKGTRFYKLYIDDGNKLRFYEDSPGNGKIRINPNKRSYVEISMWDSYKNKSTITFDVMPSPVVEEVPTLESMTGDIFSEVFENTLMVTSRTCADSVSQSLMWVNGVSTPVKPAYFSSSRSVFLFDLRRERPDSVVTCSGKVVTNIKHVVPSGTDFSYYGEHCDLEFPEGALFDTLYLTKTYVHNSLRDEQWTIGDRTIPLSKSVKVTLKVQEQYPAESGYSVYRGSGKSYSYIGGNFNGDKVTFNTREFGTFTILKDSSPPTIRAVVIDRNNARFKIKDDLSGIDKIEATINGEWVLMHYDSKTGTIFSEKLDKNTPFIGSFVLKVTDNAGNTGTFTRKIQ